MKLLITILQLAEVYTRSKGWAEASTVEVLCSAVRTVFKISDQGWKSSFFYPTLYLTPHILYPWRSTTSRSKKTPKFIRFSSHRCDQFPSHSFGFSPQVIFWVLPFHIKIMPPQFYTVKTQDTHLNVQTTHSRTRATPAKFLPLTKETLGFISLF